MATTKSTLNSDNLGTIISLGAGGEYTSNATETSYFDSTSNLPTETSVGNIIPFSGTIRNLWVNVYDNTLDAGSTVFTLVKNGTDTAITLTVAFGVTSITGDTTHTASVVAGDRISLKVVSTGTTGTAYFGFSYQVK